MVVFNTFFQDIHYQLSSFFVSSAYFVYLLHVLRLLSPKDLYITWLSNFLIVSVPDEGYSERT